MVVARNFEVPETGQFPNSNSRCGGGVSSAEVALATRAFFQLRCPPQTYGESRGVPGEARVAADLDPPCMPSFQPIELFWQHDKQYASFDYDTKRAIKQVWEQVWKGWYGDEKWEGQDGGWKPADCGKVVAHAIQEM